MRTLFALPVALLAIAPLAAQTSTPPKPPTARSKAPLVKRNEPEKPAAFMFVQTADAGTFSPVDNSGKRYKLTLSRVSPETVYFSDRPQRIAGGVEMSKFLKSFPFAPSNPPNAAVVLTTPKSQDEDVIVVELMNPVYDAAKKTLTYDVSMLPGTPPGLAFYAEKRDERLPASFDAVSLFIDDCPDGEVTCYGGYQCQGGGESEHCCRENCGGLGFTVGFCWTWIPPGCNPCHDYSNECDQGPCRSGSGDPLCVPHTCNTKQMCS